MRGSLNKKSCVDATFRDFRDQHSDVESRIVEEIRREVQELDETREARKSAMAQFNQECAGQVLSA